MGDAAEKMDDLVAVRREPKTIASIDARLQRWAAWSLDGRGKLVGGIGASPVATIMDSCGHVVRSTAPASSMPDDIFDTDRAVTQLPAALNQVVREHYLHSDADEVTRVANCNCSPKTYYRRLARAHHAIQFMLKAPAHFRASQRR